MAKHSSLFRTIAIIVTTTTLTLSVAGAAIAIHALRKNNLPDSQIPGGEGQQGQTLKSIDKVEKTNTYGLIDEYTIYYTDGTSSIFIVTNGSDGQPGAQGFPGVDGVTPTITIENGKWVINGTVTDLDAVGPQGPQGPAGTTPHIGDNGNWWIGETDTGVSAQGQSPHIGDNGNWFIGETDTGVSANGQAGRSIVSVEKTESQGLIDVYTITYSDNTTSTFLVTNGAEGAQGQGIPGQDGHTPEITIGENGNWFVDGVDTNIRAQGPQGEQGQAGLTPRIGENGNWWIGETDTGIKAQGEQGEQGQAGQSPHIGENGNWWIGETDTGVKAQGEQGPSGQTAHIGENGNWWIGETDTGVAATGPQGQAGQTPHIGENGNWWIGETDTGVKAQGEQGQAGQNGSSVLTGSGAPAADLGNNNDSYIDTATWNYYVKENGAWVLKGNFKGEAGESISIASCVKTGENGLISTYTITFSNGDTATFDVINGEDGQDGHTPVIEIDNTTGNWVIDDVDTGVAAQGPQGETGNGISNIVVTASSADETSYRIIFTDGSHFDYTVANGQDGVDGADGTCMRTGTGAPADSLGANGDSYIDTATWDYYVKDNDAWERIGNIKGQAGQDGEDGVSITSVARTSGDGSSGTTDTYTITYSDNTTSTFTVTNGADGNTILVGIGAPGAGTGGVDGDSYIDTENWIYYLKVSDSWVSQGCFKGEDGRGIESITKEGPAEDGLTYTYTVNYSDGSTPFVFTVTNGRNGNSVLTGNVAPTTQGVDGDSYINLSNWDFFVKEDGAWVLKGNIKGCSLLTGNGEPAAELGKVGDSYLDADTGDVYAKTDTGWGEPIGNIEGANFLTGTGDPAAELGKVGDSYLDVASGYVFKKTDTGWGEPIGNVKGANFLTGNGDPTAELGKVGDSYLDIETGKIYTKTDTGWGTEIGNIHKFFTVEFDLNGGTSSPIEEQEIQEGRKVTSPTDDPEYTEWIFQGWYTDPVAGSKWDFDKDVVSSDITLYAHWAKFKVENGVLTECTAVGDVTIPEFFNDQLVTAIGDEVFKNNTDITSVTIPNTVTSIGNNAFEGCSGLQSMVIPHTVKTIGDNAFKDCSNIVYFYIETVNINSSGLVPFRAPGAAASYGLETIGAGAFSGCSSLKAFSVPNSVKTIGVGAFADCNSLESFASPFIGGSAAGIGSKVYAGRLSSGQKPSNSIGNDNDLYLDANISTLYRKINGEWVSQLVLTNADGDVASCDYGSSDRNQYESAQRDFYLNPINGKFWIKNDRGYWGKPQGNIADAFNSFGYLFAGANGEQNITSLNSSVPESLKAVAISNMTELKSGAFAGCSHIETIVLSNKLTVIGAKAFSGCESLKDVNLSDNLTTIGDYAFEGCSSLTSFAIPESVTSVGFGILAGKQGWVLITNNLYMESYSPGENEGSVGDWWLDGDTEYALYQKTDDTTWTKVKQYSGWGEIDDSFDWDGNLPDTSGFNSGDYYYVYEDTGYYSLYQLKQDSNIQSLVLPSLSDSIGNLFGSSEPENNAGAIPESLKAVIVGGETLGDYAFAYCSNIEIIALKDSITSIGNHAFDGCSALKTIALPNGVKSIGESAFEKCSSLTAITLNEGLLSIGDYAFRGCVGLKSFSVPNSVTSIGKGILASLDGGIIWQIVPNDSVRLLIYLWSWSDGYPNLYDLQGDPRQYDFILTINPYTDDEGTEYETNPEYVYYNIFSYWEDDGQWWDETYNYSFTLSEETLEEAAYGELYSDGYADDYQAGQYLWVKFNNPYETNFTDYTIYLLDYSKQAIPLETLVVPYLGDGDGNNNYIGYFFDGNDPEYQSSVLPVTLSNIVITGDQNIGDKAFYGCKNIKSVKIIGDVKEIGVSAFEQAASMKEVLLPNGLLTVGERAFYECDALETLVIPNSVTSIGYNFNAYSDGLKSLSIPIDCYVYDYYYYSGTDPFPWERKYQLEYLYITGSGALKCNYDAKNIIVGKNVTEIIAPGLHYNATHVENIIIEGNLTKIPQGAFSYFTGLKTIVLPDSITEIEDSAFTGCSALRNINMPTSLTTIGNNAFENCSSLSALNIPYGVTSIGDSAFEACSGLLSVSLPASVTSIGESGFEGCSSIVSLVIPASVTSIGRDALRNCDSLKYLSAPYFGGTYEPGTEGNFYSFSSMNIVLGNHGSQTTTTYLDTFYLIGNGTIYHSAFGYVRVKHIVIGENITLNSYGGNFAYCDQVVSISFMNKFTNLPKYCFYGCRSLQSVAFPNNVEIIGPNAFNSCTSLTTIAIPDTVTAIQSSAFANCSALTSISIPDRVNTIGNGAFLNCTSLVSVVVPNTVTSMWGVFNGCSSLIYVMLPNNASFTSLGGSMFANCISLKGVVIPETVTVIGDGAFLNCISMESIALPSGVTRIDNNAFKDCTALKNIVLPDYLTTLGTEAFSGCTALESIVVPNGPEIIYANTFLNCTSLKSAYLPNSVVQIQEGVFKGCSSLETLSIPFIGRFNVSNFANAERVFGYIFGYDTHNTESGATYDGDGVYQYSVGEKDYYYLIPASLRNVIITNASENNIVMQSFNNCSMLESVVVDCPNSNVSHWAFGGCTNIKHLTIPANAISTRYFRELFWTGVSPVLESITVIGDAQIYRNTFEEQCGSVKTIIFTGTMSEINYRTFYGCTSLETVVLPEGITTIGESAFYGCSSLKAIVIPDSVTSIGYSAFEGCTSLEFVKLSSTLETIGYNIFKDCSSLNNVALPATLTAIPYNAFLNCSSLESIVIPDSVTSIGYSAFEGCTSLEYAVLPNNAAYTTIAGSLFKDCSSLKAANIPNNVTVINIAAFYGCSSLVSVEIPNSVTEMGKGMLDGCTSLETLSIPFVGGSNYSINDSSNPAANTTYCRMNYIFDVDYTKDNTPKIPASLKTIIITGDNYELYEWAFEGCNNVKSVTFAGNIDWLDKALIGCTSLEYLELPATYKYDNETTTKSVTMGNLFNSNIPLTLKTIVISGGEYIGNSAFVSCKIESIEIPNSITSIGNGAFYNCRNLESIVIPGNVTSIGEQAFRGCLSLKTVVMLNGVTSIGGKGFYECAKLESVIIPSSLTTISGEAFRSCTSLKSIVIPNGVATIGAQAFHSTPLESIVIPDSVTSIGAQAFMNCSSLKYVTLSTNSSFTTLSDNIFNGCTSIEHIDIPDNITRINSKAFMNCSSLESIVIPDSVTYIESGINGAFQGCSNLQSLTMPYVVNKIPNLFGEDTSNVPASLKNVTLTGNFTEIKASAFEGCTGLTSVVIPDSVTTIGDYAFKDCSSLKEIDFPSSLTDIGIGAFMMCTSLENVYITPSSGSFGTIGAGAFYQCLKLKSVLVQGIVEKIDEAAFAACVSLTSCICRAKYIEKEAFSSCMSLTNFMLSQNIKEIGDSAFQACTSLSSILCEETFDHSSYSFTIGDHAFDSCTSLSSINLKSNAVITSVGDFAFNDCSSLATFIFNDGLTSIGSGAFKNCYNLGVIRLPVSLTSIADYAFIGCVSLRKILYGGADATAWGQINIGTGNECLNVSKIYNS